MLELGDDRKARAEAFAEAAGVSLADVVRHALDRHLAYPPDLTPLPPAPPPPTTPQGRPKQKPAAGG